jgi:hypothetical protein
MGVRKSRIRKSQIRKSQKIYGLQIANPQISTIAEVPQTLNIKVYKFADLRFLFATGR